MDAAARRTSLAFFLVAVLFLGVNHGIMSAGFNNYLHDTFKLGADQRGFLEFPREFPGFAIIFVTGLLSAFSIRLWAVLVGVFSTIGVVGLGLLSPTAGWMTMWMLLWSLADHLFMPVEATIGLRLGEAGGHGRRLGQIQGWRFMAAIAGAGLVLLFAGSGAGGSTDYTGLFIAAGAAAAVAAVFFARVRVPDDGAGAHRAFVVHKRYWLFYALNMLFGARKQLFLTFAPWVLVSQFQASPATMATLIMVASAIGAVFRQSFGYLVDLVGERVILALDAVILLGICAGFALSREVWLLFALYVLDNLMFATRIARMTYLNRITPDRSEIAATVSLGISLDHIVAMTLPALGGLLWNAAGYQAVFWAASGIAVLNFLAALRIPKHEPVLP